MNFPDPLGDIRRAAERTRERFRREDPLHSQARFFFEALQSHIIEKELATGPNEALVVHAVLSDGSRIVVDNFGFRDPAYFYITGRDNENRSVEIAAMSSSIQVLMTVIEIKDPLPEKRPIGFIVE